MFEFIVQSPNLGLLILRVVLGLIFFIHGWQKLSGIEAVTQSFSQMGFRPAAFWGILVGLIEFFGGLLVVFGIYAEFAALVLALHMLIAIAAVKIRMGFIGGYEFDLILLASSLAIVFIGPGNLILRV